jgi:hypothetical protein
MTHVATRQAAAPVVDGRAFVAVLVVLASVSVVAPAFAVLPILLGILGGILLTEANRCGPPGN